MESGLVWKALADPVRRSLLDALRCGPRTTGTLAAGFDLTRFGVMKHLGVLEDAGLIIVEKRGREKWNYLNAARLKQATGRWLTPFQDALADRLNGLAALVSDDSPMETATHIRELDIRQELVLPAPRARAFSALTEGINSWWGMGYRQAGHGSTLTLAAEAGSNMTETGIGGHTVIWGRVEEVRIPDRIYVSGRFAVMGAVAGRIHFDLDEAANDQTLLKLSHQAVGIIPPEMTTRFTVGWEELLGMLRGHLLNDGAGK